MAQDKTPGTVQTGKPHDAAPLRAAPDFKDPSLYINRELSWLEFNRRVLEEAQDQLTPVLEKLKFASIFSSNLDEYFMVRVGGIMRMMMANLERAHPDGMTPGQELEEIAVKAQGLVAEQYRCINRVIMPQLEKAGIFVHRIDGIDEGERKRLTTYFEEQVFPILTPLVVNAVHPFPFIGNLRLNIMVMFKEKASVRPVRSYALVEVPPVLKRLIPVRSKDRTRHFVLLEDLIRRHIHRLFPGMEVTDVFEFRVTRNHDYDIQEEDVVDIVESMQTQLRDRARQKVVRLEISRGVPQKQVALLRQNLGVDDRFIFSTDGPLDIRDFMCLYDLPADASCKDRPFNPRLPKRFAGERDIFSVIREGDTLLHHPYDSFTVVMDFINAAADDPDVLAIKMTLYRVGKDSPIITALMRAAEKGKQVTAVLELKARFDEEHNIDLAWKMQEAGINAVFGFVRWKTHCKATLVVRREGRRLRRYVHVSSGNYNAVTARLYTDIGLLTCDEDFGNDVSSLFNALTGFNSWTDDGMVARETLTSMFRRFMISPVTTNEAICRLIGREAAKSTPEAPGRIIAKMNSLVDPGVIAKLYEASCAGVRIDLLVRGICCLRPGLPGVSENIRVISVLDRFLEHSRLYYFHNAGDPEIYSGSADWMPRNFHKRVEILYPILCNGLRSRIIDEILMTYLGDNVKGRMMLPDGSYVRRRPADGEHPVRSQSELIAIARQGGVKSAPYEELVKKLGVRKETRPAAAAGPAARRRQAPKNVIITSKPKKEDHGLP